MTPTSMTGQEYLAAALHGYGITHVFHVPTVAVPALAAMERRGVVGVTTHGEKAAAYMADGYARARGGPGVCMAQSIGSANLAAGLRDAYMAGTLPDRADGRAVAVRPLQACLPGDRGFPGV